MYMDIIGQRGGGRSSGGSRGGSRGGHSRGGHFRGGSGTIRVVRGTSRPRWSTRYVTAYPWWYGNYGWNYYPWWGYSRGYPYGYPTARAYDNDPELRAAYVAWQQALVSNAQSGVPGDDVVEGLRLDFERLLYGQASAARIAGMPARFGQNPTNLQRGLGAAFNQSRQRAAGATGPAFAPLVNRQMQQRYGTSATHTRGGAAFANTSAACLQAQAAYNNPRVSQAVRDELWRRCEQSGLPSY